MIETPKVYENPDDNYFIGVAAREDRLRHDTKRLHIVLDLEVQGLGYDRAVNFDSSEPDASPIPEHRAFERALAVDFISKGGRPELHLQVANYIRHFDLASRLVRGGFELDNHPAWLTKDGRQKRDLADHSRDIERAEVSAASNKNAHNVYR